jgi:malic enzyme
MLIEGRNLKEPAKREFAWPDHLAAAYGFAASAPPKLLAVVDALRPTVLVGVSGEPGAINEPVVRAMARHVDRPVILPFSNPTSKSEAIPADLMAWSDGRALVATGSPFVPVEFDGRTIRFGQGNNVYIFPGVGLGALVSEARVVTDEMFAAAATALAERVSEADLASGSLYPPITELRSISTGIAEAVVRTAVRSGVAGRQIPDDAIADAVRSAMWVPEYPALEPIYE